MYFDTRGKCYVKEVPSYATNQQESFFKSADPSKIRDTSTTEQVNYNGTVTVVVEPINVGETVIM